MEYVYAALTEEVIMNYDALPKALNGWKMYRVEYGGFNESCIMEKMIYLPPFADPHDIEKILRTGQKPKRYKNVGKE